jgi:outer membrane protein TolC
MTCFLFIQAQNLDELISYALHQNPKLKSFTHTVSAMSSMAETGAYLPDPNFKATYFPEDLMTGNRQIQLNFEQSFPWFGSLGLKEDIGRKSAAALSQTQAAFRLELVQEISSYYYELAALQEKFGLLENYEHLLQAFSQSALTRYQNGSGSQQDILKIQTERSAIENRRLGFAALRLRALSRLNRLCFTQLDSLKAVFPTDDFINPNEAQTHPTIQALQEQKTQAALKLRLSEKKSMPNFSIGFMYNMIDEPAGVSGNKDAFGISLGLSLPLWRGKYSHEEASYVSEATALDELILDREKEIEEDLRFLKVDIADKRRSLILLKNDLIPKAQLSLKASISAYETGQSSFLNLLDAQRFLLTLQTQEIEQRQQMHVALSMYKKQSASFEDRIDK